MKKMILVAVITLFSLTAYAGNVAPQKIPQAPKGKNFSSKNKSMHFQSEKDKTGIPVTPSKINKETDAKDEKTSQ